MIKTCKRCKNIIPDIKLSEEIKLELYGLVYQDMKLFAIKKLKNENKINLKEAKIIVNHLNKRYGKCVSCDYEDLSEENIECPKCKAFNYNMREPVFNQDFCSILEFSLSFSLLENDEVKNFWCDGIDPIPFNIKNLAIENLKKHKEIKTRAWTGVSGQEVYEMTIFFGDKSIHNYEKGLSLEDCIYNENFNDWIKVNPHQKLIEIKLK